MRLYQEHAAGLWRYAASMARSQEDAGDAVQETFLRYFIERSYGRGIGQPRAWLYQVVHNYLLDARKAIASKREVASEGLDDVPDGRENPEQQLARREMAQHFAAALTERELDCVRLREAGLSYVEIAATMGISHGTVGAFLARAHRKLGRVADERDASRPFAAQTLPGLFLGAEA